MTWSIVDADWSNATGQNFFTGPTVALSSFLPADFLAQIQSDFDAWAAVANIAFQQVADGGGNMGIGTTAMIRICGGFIDGNSGTNVVGRAFFPPNGAVRDNHGQATVYASWDGATQVASWRVLAGSIGSRPLG